VHSTVPPGSGRFLLRRPFRSCYGPSTFIFCTALSNLSWLFGFSDFLTTANTGGGVYMSTPLSHLYSVSSTHTPAAARSLTANTPLALTHPLCNYSSLCPSFYLTHVCLGVRSTQPLPTRNHPSNAGVAHDHSRTCWDVTLPPICWRVLHRRSPNPNGFAAFGALLLVALY